MLIAALLLVSILIVLTAGIAGAAGIVVGYSAGWAHSAWRSP